MSTFDADLANHTGIEWRGDVGIVQYGNDKNMVVMFYNRSVHNPKKSTEQGVPVYEDRTFVRVHPPGERLNIVDRPADGKDARRWPVQWHQYSQHQEQKPDGVPVGLLYPDKPAVEATLRAHNIHTVEQLANLNANAIESVGMGCQSWVNAAVRYLEVANKGVNASQMRKELETRDSEIRSLKHMVERLTEEINRMKSNNTNSIPGSLDDKVAAEVQRVLGNMAGRPQYPLTGATALDPQVAQINATHPTNLVAEKAVKKAGRPKAATKQ